MEGLLRIVFWIGFGLALVGWLRKDRFVEHAVLPREVLEEPVQGPVGERQFQINFRDVDYQIHRKYSYEIVGMVVSYRQHDGDTGLHRRWNDHVNVADLCVVWGKNLQGVDLNQFEFFNGEFTCNFSTRDAQAWAQFVPEQLSNNHLITDWAELRDRIADVRVGDLIRVRGHLVHYGEVGAPERYLRKTSITRTDTGNGACETIYVDDFQVLQSMPNPWRPAFTLGGWTAVLSGGFWLFGVATGRLGGLRSR